jgi:purine-binding chemotaxis protein CheW
MSDNDDDERLDRAKRIRKMREGDSRDAAEPSGDGGEPTDSGRDSETEAPSSKTTDEAETSERDTASEEPEEMDTNTDPDGDAGEGTDVPDVNVPETSTADETTADSPDTEDDVSAPLPDTEQLEEALESSEATADTATPEEVADADTATPAGALDDEENHEDETRVLEFKLGDEYYCLDIDYIEEIVKEEKITRVPNTPEYVEGVVDLRGQITTILNPKVTIDKDDVSPGGLIIVFDSESFEDQGHIGWVVDDVRQVSPITDDDVNEPPVQENYINGVIDRDEDEQFVIWAEPSMAMEEAE